MFFYTQLFHADLLNAVCLTAQRITLVGGTHVRYWYGPGPKPTTDRQPIIEVPYHTRQTVGLRPSDGCHEPSLGRYWVIDRPWVVQLLEPIGRPRAARESMWEVEAHGPHLAP